MARYFEVYAFQGSNWSLIQAFEGDRSELELLVSDIYIRHRVLGIRVVSEEEGRNGDKRMRVVTRRDKREGLPPFALSADGKPLYGGKPLGNPHYEMPRINKASDAERQDGRSGNRSREPSIFDLGDWFKAGLIVLGAAVALLVVDRIRNVPAEYEGLLDAIRVLLLTAIVLAMARPLIRTWRSGALFVALSGPRSKAAQAHGGSQAPFSEMPDDSDVLVRQAIGLVDESFRRVRDGLDDFGWLGFRLFLAGMTKAMAPAGPEARQRELLQILLERIGDTKGDAELFVARGYAMFENDRNARMAEAGATAWEGNDATAFERAIEWWNAPGAAELAKAPLPRTALVCLIARNASGERRAELQSHLAQLASLNDASDRGDANAHTMIFAKALTAVAAASDLMRQAGDKTLRIGLATDSDVVEAAVRARSLADNTPPDGASADAATQVAVPDESLWTSIGENGVASLKVPPTSDQSAA
jgi:hypothetical protein